VKLLIDMNLSPRWVESLTAAGIESTHWSTIGAPSASDSDLMSFARNEGYVVLTHDLDFGSILAATHGDKPSVVQIRAANPSPESVGEAVIGALVQLKTELEAGALLTVEPARTRARLLPLEPRP
jgi:predicted nuclease of predicted toxin-antitoxin system